LLQTTLEVVERAELLDVGFDPVDGFEGGGDLVDGLLGSDN
jgi:hypothetical protein